MWYYTLPEIIYYILFYLNNLQMRKYLLLTGIVCTIVSCQKMNENKQTQTSEADTPSSNSISSSAAKEKNDPDRKFIRTADIKFKVENVEKSTYNIEDVCNNHGGFVTYTNLTSNVDEHTETNISKDSLLETTLYTVTNNITLRIPNTKLDTTLKDIAKNVDYLDYRIIKADDMRLQILGNDFTQIRNTKNLTRLSNDIEKNTKVLDQTTQAEEVILSKQEIADNAKLANLSLNDQIKFSTVNIAIYQRQGVKRNVVYNEKNIDKYDIGLGHKIIESVLYGWKLLVILIVSITKVWGIALFAGIAFAGYKWYTRKRKSKQ
jgi:Domain of unknown function (DUF4349)